MSDPTLSSDGQPAPYRQHAARVIEYFKTDADRGLTTTEAQARLARYGKNELAHAPPPPAWRKFLAQFQNPLTGLLLAATVISFVAWLIEDHGGLPYETITILAIVILNAVLGFIQENRAEHAVAALQAMTAPTARVMRDGAQKTIRADEVVPGDVLLIEEGDTLPADARVIESIALRVAESALTGESASVSKDSDPIPEQVGIGDQHNMVFGGTAITSGRGRAIVVSTGAATQIGKIAGSLQEQKEEATPLQKELDNVGTLLGRIVIVIAISMGITLLIVNRATRSLDQFVDILLLAVSLAVAAVPEGLTAITTIVLSLGMSRMAKRNVIVRKLSAVETLGSTTVICTDKTGTLTKNEMTVRAVVTPLGRVDITGIGYEPEGEMQENGVTLSVETPLGEQTQRTLRFAALANNANVVEQGGRWVIQGDPTEAALVVAAYKVGLTAQQLRERFQRVAEMPFSSERKMMSAAVRDAEHLDRIAVASKGAPDVLLSRCANERIGSDIRPLTPERRVEIQQAIHELALQALRTLGVAYRYLDRDRITGKITEEHEGELTWLGAVGMIDPPRQEAREAVRIAQSAGVRSIMITGDHPATGAAIARELGILEPDGRAVTGAELQRTDEIQLRDLVKRFSVFARVAPEHKLRIVRALKANGEIAAMTGDGVNDAPALKAADIGVAMGITGTDVSKGASDMILTDDNFASIVAAVEEGRSIFANIQKFLRYLLSSNIGEVLVMFFGVVLGGIIGLAPEEGSSIIVPLLAVQILWINLLTDSGPALALGVDPPDPNVMKKKPRDPRSRVITHAMWFDIAFVGAIMMVGTLAVMDASLRGGIISGVNGGMEYAQTMAFTTLVFFQLFNALNARSDELSAFSGLFANKWLWVALGVSVVLQILVIYLPFLQQAFNTVPLSPTDWVVCILVGSTVLWLRELVKFWDRRRRTG
ncbi:MAG: cation-translocating P-type ATPase [Anaerolineae bacterium]|nr:cation-translocating P-type ATPase [Anaerolineae bacterium]